MSVLGENEQRDVQHVFRHAAKHQQLLIKATG
jgi:hypothetical protein